MDSERLTRYHVDRRFRAMVGKIFVICAFVCLSACGQKKDATDNTTSDGAMQVPSPISKKWSENLIIKDNSMKTMILGLIGFGTVWLTFEAMASPIQDPIVDYLGMQVPARSEYVGTLEFVKRVKVDVDGDGNDEVFIGTSYRYSGAKHDFNWAGYIPVEDGFQRITPSDEDFSMATFEDIYIGPLTEISKQGLAQRMMWRSIVQRAEM